MVRPASCQPGTAVLAASSFKELADLDLNDVPDSAGIGRSAACKDEEGVRHDRGRTGQKHPSRHPEHT